MAGFDFLRRGSTHSGGRKPIDTHRARLAVEELEPRFLPSSNPVVPPSVMQTYSLVTLSGQSASLVMGGEQPVVQSAAHGQKSVVFEPFGAQLQFLPTLLQDGSIKLQLNIEQSGPTERGEGHDRDAGGDGPSALGVHTTVDLESGQTMVVAQDPSLPFLIEVTPQVVVRGPAAMVQLTVTEVAPRALISSLPAPVRPTDQGQATVTDTYHLAALNGQAASLLVGGRQFLPDSGGTFEPFGAHFTIVPTVQGDGSIRLDVQAGESVPNDASGARIRGAFVPGQLALDVQTSVDLKNGQTILLAGAQGLPFEVLVTPQFIFGAGKLIDMTVTVVEPEAFAAALPPAVRPTTSGQTPVLDTYTLTALSGAHASLFLGGQSPLPGSGGQLERVGAQVNVVPIVLAGGKIQLDVDVEESARNRGPGQIILDLHTSVEMSNQETLLLGGDEGLPFEVFITPELIAGKAGMVSMTVKVAEPAAFAAAQPHSLQPLPPGKIPQSRTLTLSAPSGGSASLNVDGTQLTIFPIVLNNGAIMLGIELQQGASRKHGSFLDLKTSVLLSAGQTLVLGSDPDLPLEILVTPELNAGNMVSVTVTVVAPGKGH